MALSPRRDASSARHRCVRRCRRLCAFTRCVFKAYSLQLQMRMSYEVAVSDKMSSEEEDLFVLVLNKYRKKKRTKQRRFWVHAYLQNNHDKRLSLAAKEIYECDEKFKSFYRLRKATFSELLEVVGPLLL